MNSLTRLPSLSIATAVRTSVLFTPMSGKEQTDPNNNAGGAVASPDKHEHDSPPVPKRGDKYSLRPRSLQKRAETEQRGRAAANTRSKRGEGTSGTTRPKQKPPPLSKYRRKTANARERDRMREINAAFETLRRAVPHISTSAHQNQHDSNGSEKLTKITTLRLAMKYIAALSQALQQSQMSQVRVPILPPPSSISSSSSSSSGSLQLLSDGESLTFSEHCLTPPDLRQESLTPPDFTGHCLTPADLTSADLNRHCLTPPDPSQQCLTPPEFNRRCMTPPDLRHQCLTSPDLSQHCLTPPHCLTPSDFADHSLTAADFGDSLTPPDFSTHSLTSPDFGDPCLTPPGFSDLSPWQFRSTCFNGDLSSVCGWSQLEASYSLVYYLLHLTSHVSQTLYRSRPYAYRNVMKM